MNKKASLCSIVILLLVTVLSFAAEKGKESAAAEKKPQVRQPRRASQQTDAQTPARPGLGRGPMNPDERSQMYSRMTAQRGSSHQELIQELLELKKVAQEENATKTVAAIEALIESKNALYKQEQIEQEQRREEFRKRMQERMNRQRQTTGSTGAESSANQPSSIDGTATRTNQN